MIPEDPGEPSAPPVIWASTPEFAEPANVTGFIRWLEGTRGLRFAGYPELWDWSVTALEEFWSAVWEYYAVRAAHPPETALAERVMPGARWFPGSELSYAEHVLRYAADDRPAIIGVHEDQPDEEISWRELRGRVGAIAAALTEMGVQRGDRVAAYLPNVPEAVIAMLAVTSLGAVWAACAPDFGTSSVVDRFAQLEPKVLIATTGYRFGGRHHDRTAAIAELRSRLPSLEHTIVVGADVDGAASFAALAAEPREPEFAPVPFDHPLWVLFSSGTTGIPKGIVQSTGGILVEHLKSLGLCMDLRPGDRYLFFSSTSWMAWNYLVGGLLHGCTIVVYDGSPSHPGPEALWELARRVRASVLGMGSAYVTGCQKAGLRLGDRDGLRSLRTVIPTGSPLPITSWRWLEENLPAHTRIDSICGGTDVCTAFLGGSPLLPVWEGEISGRWLGIKAEAFNPDGQSLIDAVGEFVVTEPMPSMPIGLWNDPDGSRLRDAYFELYDGVWRQGDWITLSGRGSLVVHGRSDATLNRGGVRLGSAEIYGAVERLDAVRDSLVVGLEEADGAYYMPLFVVPSDPDGDPTALSGQIRDQIREQLSPRHVPDEIMFVAAIPRTLTGKKLEVPIKRLLGGAEIDDVAAVGAIDDPEALRWFAEFARARVAAGR